MSGLRNQLFCGSGAAEAWQGIDLQPHLFVRAASQFTDRAVLQKTAKKDCLANYIAAAPAVIRNASTWWANKIFRPANLARSYRRTNPR